MSSFGRVPIWHKAAAFMVCAVIAELPACCYSEELQDSNCLQALPCCCPWSSLHLLDQNAASLCDPTEMPVVDIYLIL